MSAPHVDLTTLPAGRDLDAVVAERVMGYEWRRFDYPPAGQGYRYGKPWTWLSSEKHGDDPEGDETKFIGNVPHFSTDIAAAFLVVERMREQGWQFHMNATEAPDSSNAWCAWFARPNDTIDGKGLHRVGAKAPVVIVHAALAARAAEVGGDE